MTENLHFAGQMIKSNNNWVVTDRLGSVVRSGTETLRYFPWGEERTTTTQNRDKFGAYFRDASGLDYALNRYYSSSHGRFLTPDPYVASASLTNPQSWDRYPYVENDPVNFVDPQGLNRRGADFSVTVYATRYYDVNELWSSEANYWAGIWGWGGGGGGSPPALEQPRGGGGGGSSEDSEAGNPPRQFVLGRAEAMSALFKPDCAKAVGAPDSATARNRLANANIEFADLGAFVVEDRGDHYKIAAGSGTIAQAIVEANAIQINTRLNWIAPDLTPARIDGSQNLVIFDFLAATAQLVGANSVSGAQFRTRTILHELGHLNGKPQERGSAAYDRDIFKNCF